MKKIINIMAERISECIWTYPNFTKVLPGSIPASFQIQKLAYFLNKIDGFAFDTQKRSARFLKHKAVWNWS
jgi:hypothetical protein